MLYTDNGSDFTSHHLEQVAADLKVQLVFSTPGKPRGRGRIERFFETVTQLFLADQAGYAPRSPTLPLGSAAGVLRPVWTLAQSATPKQATRSVIHWLHGRGVLPHCLIRGILGSISRGVVG